MNVSKWPFSIFIGVENLFSGKYDLSKDSSTTLVRFLLLNRVGKYMMTFKLTYNHFIWTTALYFFKSLRRKTHDLLSLGPLLIFIFHYCQRVQLISIWHQAKATIWKVAVSDVACWSLENLSVASFIILLSLLHHKFLLFSFKGRHLKNARGFITWVFFFPKAHLSSFLCINMQENLFSSQLFSLRVLPALNFAFFHNLFNFFVRLFLSFEIRVFIGFISHKKLTWYIWFSYHFGLIVK